MQIATLPVLSILYKLNCRYKKRYCFPSQQKIIDLLGKYQKIERTVRTLNRWLKSLEDKKYIKRTRRIRRDPVVGYVFKSTLYKITKKGYIALWRSGIDCFDKIKKFSTAVKSADQQNDQSPQLEKSTDQSIDKKGMRQAWRKAKQKISNITLLFNL